MLNLTHKITLERASLYFDTEDISVLLKWWQKPFKARFQAKFMQDFNQLFSGKLNLSDEAFKLLLFNRAYNLLPALHEALRYSLLSGNKKILAKNMEAYEQEFGVPFLKVEDLKRIKREISRLRDKYDAYRGELNTDKFDFEKLVFAVEQILGQPINRQLKLYQFKVYYDKAKKDGRNKTVS